MPRRLTDTYFVRCSFNIRFETNQQIITTQTCTGIYVIPEIESVAEYIKTATERQVKKNFGNDYKIKDFVITEIIQL